LGHYLHDQFYITQCVQAVMPEVRNKTAPPNYAGGYGYIARFRNLQTREKDFLRGYAFDFQVGGTPDGKYFPLYGKALDDALDAHRGTGFTGTCMGEVLPRFENHVRINKDVTDAWGIPVLHVQARYGSNEFNMAKDAIDTMSELCRACGWEVLARNNQPFPPGYSIHEVGTCRMGDNPKTSVLNKWNQSWDIKNLFVVDGSSFVTSGSQNPTMTILSLSMRASEYLAGQMRKGEL
jgi:choline dehydrogenase-like flavoprotein